MYDVVQLSTSWSKATKKSVMDSVGRERQLIWKVPHYWVFICGGDDTEVLQYHTVLLFRKRDASRLWRQIDKDTGVHSLSGATRRISITVGHFSYPHHPPLQAPDLLWGVWSAPNGKGGLEIMETG